MADMYAIYGLEATGVNGEYETTGEVHYYCTENHAERHAIAQGFRSSANYSKPTPNTDAIPGTKCEWCGEQVVPDDDDYTPTNYFDRNGNVYKRL